MTGRAASTVRAGPNRLYSSGYPARAAAFGARPGAVGKPGSGKGSPLCRPTGTWVSL